MYLPRGVEEPELYCQRRLTAARPSGFFRVALRTYAGMLSRLQLVPRSNLLNWHLPAEAGAAAARASGPERIVWRASRNTPQPPNGSSGNQAMPVVVLDACGADAPDPQAWLYRSLAVNDDGLLLNSWLAEPNPADPTGYSVRPAGPAEQLQQHYPSGVLTAQRHLDASDTSLTDPGDVRFSGYLCRAASLPVATWKTFDWLARGNVFDTFVTLCGGHFQLVSGEGRERLQPIDARAQPLSVDGVALSAADHMEELRRHPVYSFLFQQWGGPFPSPQPELSYDSQGAP